MKKYPTNENLHVDFTTYPLKFAFRSLEVISSFFNCESGRPDIFCLWVFFVPECHDVKVSWPSYYRHVVRHFLENVKALPFSDVRITRCWPRIHYLLLEAVSHFLLCVLGGRVVVGGCYVRHLRIYWFLWAD